MARIRSLKPDHKSHRKVGPLTDRQYRLWVGMLTEADDEGRLVADAGQLRLQIFGYHPTVRPTHIEEALSVLVAVGLVHTYIVDKVRYAQFPSWKDHQVINKGVRSKLPSPNHSRSATGVIHGGSGSDTGVVSESSGSTPVGSEGSGSGREGSGSEGSDPGCPVDNVAPSQEQAAHQQPSREEQLRALAMRNGLTPEQLSADTAELARRQNAEAKTPPTLRRVKP